MLIMILRTFFVFFFFQIETRFTKHSNLFTETKKKTKKVSEFHVILKKTAVENRMKKLSDLNDKRTVEQVKGLGLYFQYSTR